MLMVINNNNNNRKNDNKVIREKVKGINEQEIKKGKEREKVCTKEGKKKE